MSVTASAGQVPLAEARTSDEIAHGPLSRPVHDQLRQIIDARPDPANAAAVGIKQDGRGDYEVLHGPSKGLATVAGLTRWRRDRLGKLDIASHDALVDATRMPGRQLRMVRAGFPQIADA